MQEKLFFAVDKVDLIEASDSQFAELVMEVCSPGENAHQLYFDEDTMIRAMPSLAGKPILAKYNRMSRDAGTHEHDEVPIGFVPHEKDITIETRGGKPWIIAKGKIWKIYAREMMEVLRRRQEAAVSMEILSNMEVDKNGRKILTDFVFAGITVLGKSVTPAIQGAKLKMLKFSEMEKALESETFAHRYSVIDFTIPDEVKSAAQQGLELSAENQVAGSAANLAMARYLIRESAIDYEHARKLGGASRRFSDVNEDALKSERFIASLLWGGSEGRKWIGGIVAKMNELDQTDVTLFADDGVTPLTNPVEEADPVIPEVEPTNFAEPLTNQQIEQILRAAVQELKFGDEVEEEGEGPHDGYDHAWLTDFSETQLFVNHKGRTYRFDYVIETLVAKIDEGTKTEVIRGGYIEVGAPIDAKKEAVEALMGALGFSADEYLDPMAKVAFLIKDAEHFKDVIESAKVVAGFMREDLHGIDFYSPTEEDAMKLALARDGMSKQMMSLFAEIEEKEEDEDTVYMFNALCRYAKVMYACHAVDMQKMVALESFKASVIERDKFAKVEELLGSVSGDLSDEDTNGFRTFAKEMSMDDFDSFANSVRAKAYEHAKSNPKSLKNKKTVQPFAVWPDDVREKGKKGYIWDK